MNEQFVKAIAEYAGKVGTDKAYAETIVRSIEPNRLTVDVFSAFMPVRELNVGDSLAVQTKRKSIRAYTMVPGTTHMASRLYGPNEVLSHALDRVIAKVRHSLWEVQSGEIGTAADIRDQLARALVEGIVKRVFLLIGSVWVDNATPRTSYHYASGGITETVLENMISTVGYFTSRVRAIVGTQLALRGVQSLAGVREYAASDNSRFIVPIAPVLEQWGLTGRVTTFRGVPIIELPQIFEESADNFFSPMLPNDRIYVIGDNVGEIVLYGPTEYQEHIDTGVEPADYVLSAWRQFGVMITKPEGIGYIRIPEPTLHYHRS
jgi:hypothetical protein